MLELGIMCVYSVLCRGLVCGLVLYGKVFKSDKY